MKDDSIEGIYDTLKQCALISKSAGGIGLAVSCIRATGSYIAGVSAWTGLPAVGNGWFLVAKHALQLLGQPSAAAPPCAVLRKAKGCVFLGVPGWSPPRRGSYSTIRSDNSHLLMY